MVTASDAYDDWYEDDEPHGGVEDGWHEGAASRRLGLVRPARLAFGLVAPPRATRRRRPSPTTCAPALRSWSTCTAATNGWRDA